MEQMLGAELTAHLGYEAGAQAPADQPNRRNGVSTKRVKHHTRLINGWPQARASTNSCPGN